jgi:hypothetical protein
MPTLPSVPRPSVPAVPARVIAAAFLAGLTAVAVTGVLLNPSTLPSGGVQSETGTPAPGASVVAGVAASPSITLPQGAKSAGPGGSSPVTSAALVPTEQRVVSWRDASGNGTAQVLVAVTNQGAAPVRIDATSSTYVLKGPDGKVVARGVFSYAFPVILDPGAVGYLLDSPLGGLVPIGDKDTASVQVDVSGVSSPGNALEVTDLAWRRDPAGPISVSGTVRNTSSAPVSNGAVGVVLRDRQGRLLAALYDPIHIANMPPESSTAFTTAYPGTPSLPLSQIGSAEGFAFDLSR